MTAYTIRRLLVLPIVLIFVTMFIFGMLSLLTPYERASLYVRDIPKNPGALDAIVEKYGLDDPVPVQYWYWLVGREDKVTGETEGGLLRGNLGWSNTGKGWVVDVIGRRLPATAELALWASIPMISIGVWFGVKAAVNHNNWIDQSLRMFSIVGWSIPTFVFGLLVLIIFYARLGWFPPGRLSDWAMQVIQDPSFTQFTRLYTIDALLNLRLDIFWDAMRHLILPVITLAYLNWAYLMRLTRSSMLDVLRKDYITTARSKGVREENVVKKHALPNALIPVVTVGALMVIGLLNGVVITETIFNFPGMGSFLATSALSLDVVSVLGVTLFSCLVLVFGNLIVDILYGIIDPRIRYQ